MNQLKIALNRQFRPKFTVSVEMRKLKKALTLTNVPAWVMIGKVIRDFPCHKKIKTEVLRGRVKFPTGSEAEYSDESATCM